LFYNYFLFFYHGRCWHVVSLAGVRGFRANPEVQELSNAKTHLRDARSFRMESGDLKWQLAIELFYYFQWKKTCTL